MHLFFSFWGHISVPLGLPAELWAPILLFFSFWGHISVPHGLPAELQALIFYYFITANISRQLFSFRKRGIPISGCPFPIYSSSGPVSAAIPVSPVRTRTTSSTSYRKIFPSPGCPVYSALLAAAMTDAGGTVDTTMST